MAKKQKVLRLSEITKMMQGKGFAIIKILVPKVSVIEWSTYKEPEIIKSEKASSLNRTLFKFSELFRL